MNFFIGPWKKSEKNSQLIELFHRPMEKKKKIENPAKYELFVPKTLNLVLMTFVTSCGAGRVNHFIMVISTKVNTSIGQSSVSVCE